MQSLQKSQNREARIVVKNSFDAPAMPIIRSLNWPTVDDIIRSDIATTMYKSLNGLVPEYLSNLFGKKLTRDVRKLRNTDTDLLLPLRKTNNGQRATPFRGPKLLWNQLELNAKQAPSLATFKRIKKNYDYHSNFVVSIFLFLNFLPRPPEKQPSWTDGATVPK